MKKKEGQKAKRKYKKQKRGERERIRDVRQTPQEKPRRENTKVYKCIISRTYPRNTQCTHTQILYKHTNSIRIYTYKNMVIYTNTHTQAYNHCHYTKYSSNNLSHNKNQTDSKVSNSLSEKVVNKQNVTTLSAFILLAERGKDK